MKRGHGVEDRWIADWPIGERWRDFTRANAGEVLPTPASPLGQQFSWEKGMALGWRDGYVRSGNYALNEFHPEFPETCAFFAGYMYINLANVRMQGVRSPVVTVEQLDLAFFGEHPDVPPYVPHPLDERPDFTEGILKHLGWLMTATTWPEIDDERTTTIAFRTGRPDLTKLTDAELLARARSTQPMLQKLFESHCIPSSGSGIAPGILFAVGQAIGDPSVPMKLLAGLGHVDSAEPGYALWEMSRLVKGSPELTAAFDAGVTGLLDRLRKSGSTDANTFLVSWQQFSLDFGSRGPNEWEISQETWETKPEIALAALDRIRFQSNDESPRIRNQKHAEERERVTAEVRAKVAALGSEELAGQFEAAMVASRQMGFRERTKTNIVRVVHEGRMVFRELGRRHAAAGDLADEMHIYMLLNAELGGFIANPASFKQTLADRYTQWRALWDLEPPFFIKDGNLPPLSQYPKRGANTAAKAAVGEVLQGVAGCAGIVQGRACVVTDPSDPQGLEPGDILVAPLTDPAWTPLFMSAGGVVVNVGGQISHAIIVSRELGLPCVVSVTDATQRIPNGALIEVNGDTGQVTVLEVV
jgi:rifampicin phosphotransferase